MSLTQTDTESSFGANQQPKERVSKALFHEELRPPQLKRGLLIETNKSLEQGPEMAKAAAQAFERIAKGFQAGTADIVADIGVKVEGSNPAYYLIARGETPQNEPVVAIMNDQFDIVTLDPSVETELPGTGTRFQWLDNSQLVGIHFDETVQGVSVTANVVDLFDRK